MPIAKSSTTTHKLERELLAPVMHFLVTLGCSKVVSELRFFDRGIDVYGVMPTRPKKTYAVELKLTDWPRALQQAAVYQLCADFCYIAVPKRSIANLDFKPFRETGIGILSVRPDGSVGIIMEPIQSTEVRVDYVAALTKRVQVEAVNVT